MRRNFDLSTGLVGIGAAAVLVSLFLDWYEPGLSAWDVFEVVDWALAALAVGALVLLAGEATAATARTPRLAWICGIVALLVVAELLDPPPAARGAVREAGAWIALAGSALMVAGVVLSMARISVTIDVAERERRRRTAAVDARTAEPAAEPSEPAAEPSESDATAEPENRLWKGERRGPGPPRAEADPPEPAPGDDPDRTQPLAPADRPVQSGGDE